MATEPSAAHKEIRAPGRSIMIHYMMDGTHASAFTFEDEEGIREKWLYPEIQKGDVFLDIGAAYGSYALGALACGAGKVICFSPQFEYTTLLKNLELNTNKKLQKYKAYSLGLYSKKGYLTTESQKFFETHDEASLNYSPATENDSIIKVVPLDSFNLRTKKIDVMKLDVEGAEAHVLEGARKTIEKYKPRTIFVENHSFKVGGIQEEVISLVSTFNVQYTYDIDKEPQSAISHTRFRLL